MNVRINSVKYGSIDRGWVYSISGHGGSNMGIFGAGAGMTVKIFLMRHATAWAMAFTVLGSAVLTAEAQQTPTPPPGPGGLGTYYNNPNPSPIPSAPNPGSPITPNTTVAVRAAQQVDPIIDFG